MDNTDSNIANCKKFRLNHCQFLSTVDVKKDI